MTRPRDAYPRTRLTGAFERRVAAALHSLVEPDAAPLIVACSGGPDSTATLIAVARTHASTVVAAHFDHRMRSQAEADTERAVVCRVAAALAVTVIEGHATTTPKGEATARAARYRWLGRAASQLGASACATGHTRDDQAETVVMRLARGSGARGAAGMAAGAPWPVVTPSARAVSLVRPLLEVGRAEVEAYLDALGVIAAHDSSNDSDAFARNRVRRQVLPALRAVNERATEHLAAFATRQREDDEALTVWAMKWLGEHAHAAPDAVRLPRTLLEAVPAAVRARVLIAAAEGLGMRLGESHLEGVGRLLAGRASGEVAVAGGVVTRRGTVIALRRDA